MKFLKFIFPLLIVGCLAFASCKSDVTTSNPLSLIPSDASMVFEINGNEIFAKSGLNNPDDYKFMGLLKLNTDAYNFVGSLFRGTKDAGISVDKVIVYLTLAEKPELVAIFPVKSKTEFENWLKKAEAPQPSNEAGFSYFSDDGANLAWNDEVAIFSTLFSAANNTREKIAGHFTAKDDGLLATNADFQKFAERQADARAWIKYSSIIDLYKLLTLFNIAGIDNDSAVINPFMEEMKNISMHSYLDFEDGKIVGVSSAYPPEEVEKLKTKFPLFKKDFNREILKDIPEQSFLSFNIFVDVKEYSKYLRQTIEQFVNNAKGAYGYGIEEKSEELFDFLDSPELNSVISALGGDVILNIHGFNQGIIPYPLASTSFTVNGESAFKDILVLIPKHLYSFQEGYYTIAALQSFIPVYFAYKDNRVFISNDLEATKKFTAGSKDKTFADNQVAKIMNDKMVFYFNLDFDTYPNNIKMFLQNMMGQKFSIFVSLIEIYECMYFSGDTKYNFEYTLQLKNKNVNSLKQIFKSIDALTPSWKSLE